MEHLHTTICALATPPGEGGIATVRVSGPDAYGIVGKIFAPVRQGTMTSRFCSISRRNF